MELAGILLGCRRPAHIKLGFCDGSPVIGMKLDYTVRLYVIAVGSVFALMDDNVCLHRAVIVNDYLKSESIAGME